MTLAGPVLSAAGPVVPAEPGLGAPVASLMVNSLDSDPVQPAANRMSADDHHPHLTPTRRSKATQGFSAMLFASLQRYVPL